MAPVNPPLEDCRYSEGCIPAFRIRRRTRRAHEKRRRSTHRALVGFLSSVSSHVDDQHVLRLERLLLSTALSPLADEGLLVRVDVVVRNVLQIRIFIKLVKIYEALPKGQKLKF